MTQEEHKHIQYLRNMDEEQKEKDKMQKTALILSAIFLGGWILMGIIGAITYCFQH